LLVYKYAFCRLVLFQVAMRQMPSSLLIQPVLDSNPAPVRVPVASLAVDSQKAAQFASPDSAFIHPEDRSPANFT
jgi:hypothetical protein